jgi:hypothetical protein
LTADFLVDLRISLFGNQRFAGAKILSVKTYAFIQDLIGLPCGWVQLSFRRQGRSPYFDWLRRRYFIWYFGGVGLFQFNDSHLK